MQRGGYRRKPKPLWPLDSQGAALIAMKKPLS